MIDSCRVGTNNFVYYSPEFNATSAESDGTSFKLCLSSEFIYSLVFFIKLSESSATIDCYLISSSLAEINNTGTSHSVNIVSVTLPNFTKSFRARPPLP